MRLEVNMTAESNGTTILDTLAGIRFQLHDDAMSPDFCIGDAAMICRQTTGIQPAMAVLVEHPDGARMLRWFVRPLQDNSLLLFMPNPPNGQPRFQRAPKGSRVIGTVIERQPDPQVRKVLNVHPDEIWFSEMEQYWTSSISDMDTVDQFLDRQ
jgi:hypothetical protein